MFVVDSGNYYRWNSLAVGITGYMPGSKPAGRCRRSFIKPRATRPSDRHSRYAPDNELIEYRVAVKEQLRGRMLGKAAEAQPVTVSLSGLSVWSWPLRSRNRYCTYISRPFVRPIRKKVKWTSRNRLPVMPQVQVWHNRSSLIALQLMSY